ncbi:UbiE/COQ5 family methyltransferase [Ahrensia sp. R2A130]|nr:UbiE/COQ5 family methyltransferase [Ahrensia sp. R2A130]
MVLTEWTYAMTIANRILSTPSTLGSQGSIPIASGGFGSFEIALRRRTRTASDLADMYDGASKSWAQTSRRLGLETAYSDPLISSGAVEVLGKPSAHVLDCGIGSGSLSLALARVAQKPFDHHGIDTSSAMLAVADAELRRAAIVPQLHQADVRAIPYPDLTFDVVMAAHVLEHLSEPHLALREMVRVLKPGGVLFACMTRRSVFGTFVQLRWRTWTVSNQQGIAWLRESGLTDLQARPIELGFGTGRASTAFWAKKPLGALDSPPNDGVAARGRTVDDCPAQI